MLTLTSGIDVSQWQGTILWDKVKAAGVQFALIRAGYGDTLSYPYQIDTQFERNYAECKKNGIPVGVYFYSYATTADAAKREAQSCLALLKGKQFEMPIYYDVEEYYIFKSGKTADVSRAFISELEKAGYWVGIYTYRSAMGYFPSDIKDHKAMAIAEYGDKLNYSGQYGIWQNSSTWRVQGISGNVDHDYCYVDYPTLIKQNGKNGFAKPETRVETTQDSDILKGTADAPPVVSCVGKGNQYTIDKTVKIGAYTFGHIKGTADRWINLKTCKTI